MSDRAEVNFRTLDLNLLRVFDEAMVERNLTRAAAKLAMTQPAVSNALRRLRDALHDDLLVRAGYGVEPTPRALELWPAVRAALEGLRAAMGPGAFDPREARDSFAIAMADATAALLMPPLVRRLEAEAPGVTLRSLPLLTRDPRALLAAAQADVGIGHFPAVLAALEHADAADEGGLPAFAAERLYDGRYVCVMRAGHPLAQGPLDLDRYCAARHLLVSFSGRPFGFVDEALAALGRRRRVVLTVNQFFTAGQVVTQTDLLTVLPRHFLATTGIASQLLTRPLPMDLPVVHVDLLWHRRQAARAAHRWLREAIAAAAREAFADTPSA